MKFPTKNDSIPEHRTSGAWSQAEMSLSEFLSHLSPGTAIPQSADLPEAVNLRLPLAMAHATAQCGKAPPDASSQVMRLLSTATNARSNSKRIFWHHRAADVLAEHYAPHAACKAGCNHCCHIQVAVSEIEAVEMGKAIGRKPIKRTDHAPIEVTGYDSPCHFLKAGECSIYKYRPSVCRTHFNMDRDDLLCQHLPSGQAVPVPYLDTRAVMAAGLMISRDLDKWADLRQWFPQKTGEPDKS